MGKDLDSIKQVVEYKKTIIAFIEQALIVIDDLSQKPLDINAFKSIEEDPQQQWLVARNTYIGTVDQTCSFINAIASVPHREKEIAKRMSKNSAK